MNNTGYFEYLGQMSDLELSSLKDFNTVINDYYQSISLNLDGFKTLIRKDITKKSPMFCDKTRNNNPYNIIFINAPKFTDWGQLIYQLSHELTHLYIYSHNEKPHLIKWIEESICEAMSLFFINYFAENWLSLNIYPSKNNPKYVLSLYSYLIETMSKRGTDDLSRCSSYEELKEIEKLSDVNRDLRKNEMNGLYARLAPTPENIKALICYKNYILNDDIILDFDKYEADYPNNKAVKYLRYLQDTALGLDSELFE